MRSRISLPIFLFLVGAGLDTTASAELFIRVGGMVYDSDLNVTWLADANYAATQYAESCGAIGTVDGQMTWPEAVRWAENLDVGGYHDWRLPTAPVDDASCDGKPIFTYGSHCMGGEMSHLFYGDIKHGLGGKLGDNIIKTHNANYLLFHNFSAYGVYWTGTNFPPFGQIVFNFHTREGFSNANSKSVHNYAMAVRDGDVAEVDVESDDVESDDVHPEQKRAPNCK